jgi:hypothetical protein
MAKRGYSWVVFDKKHTSFYHPKTRSEEMTKVQQICWMVDGYGPADDIEKRIDSFEASDLREAFGLALPEIGVFDDPMDILIDQAIKYGVRVSEKDHHELRNDEMYSQSKVSFLSNPRTQMLRKDELLVMLKKARQELAWLKDNRDYLSDYVDMAEQFMLEKTEHKLKYEFYPRVSYIELLENDIREKVRHGAKSEEAQTNESDNSTKRAEPSINEETRQLP